LTSTSNIKEDKIKHFTIQGIEGELVEGKNKMAHSSSEADNNSKIALSTFSTRVNRSSSNDLDLVW